MKLENKQTFLLMGLSILLFRLLSVIFSVGMMQLRRIPLEFAMHVVEILRAYEAVIACGLAVLLSILVMRKVRTAHLAVILFVWALALLPLQFRIRQEPVRAPLLAPETSPIEALSLTARLIDGETISDWVLLDNADVARAEAVAMQDDIFQVKLFLTEDGRKIIREVTQRNVGKRIGFLLNGDLKSSPEIMEPLDIPYVMLPIDMKPRDAESIAQGIMKGKSQPEAGGYRR